MNILFDNLESLIDAPNGIEKTRELILQLAVQGKLTEQDPKDEPASELLKKIKKEKEKLIADGDIKNQSEHFPIPLEEIPFTIPNGWIFCRLNEVCNLVYGKNLPTTELIKDGYDVFGANGIIGKYSKYLYEHSQLLISCRGAYSGKPNISPIKCFVTNNSIVCEFYLTSACDINFFHSVIALPQKQNIVTGSAQPQVTIANAKNLIIPLPPIKEQKRIVAKVNSLMALLDELEEKRERRNQKRIKLNNASLEKLLKSKDDKELKANWKRIEENFSTIYSVPENVEKLKQVILQLAVQGKLVKQDPKDEPASELLKKIKKEKDKLIVEGKIKKQNDLPPIKDEEKPFELPKNWEWVRLGELIELISGQHIQSLDYNSKGVGLPYITGPADFGLLYPIITKWTEKPKVIASKDDILITVKGAGLGKLNIINIDSLVISRQLMAIRPIQVNSNYIFHYLKSKFSLFQKSGTGIAIPGLSREDITYLYFPLPPINEQKSIVDKVNELMSLCNTLEEKLTKKEATAEKLVDAVVNAVANKTNKPKDEKADKKKMSRELIEEIIKQHPKALEKLR